MEKKIKCTLLLSLKEMALRRLIVYFLSDPDILSSISKFELKSFSTPQSKRDWKELIEYRIKDKIMKLVLPESLTEQLTSLIKPISFEVREWKSSLQKFLDFRNCKTGVPDTVKLCWTMEGTIDYCKTAEELFLCNNIDIEIRYELACYYCLESYISIYWVALPGEMKAKYSNDKDNLPCLPYLWPYILQGKISELDYLWRTPNGNFTSFNQYAFEHCAEVRFKTAAEYFLEKLTHEERESSLIRSISAMLADRNRPVCPNERISDVLHFLFSAMTAEQQMEAIKAHPKEVVYYLLHWPFQDLFLENADLIWTCIPSSSYIALIEKIIYGNHYSYFYFPQMFKQFFMHSPQDFKKRFVEEKFGAKVYLILDAAVNYFLGDTAVGYFLREFFGTEDSESIKVFFRTLDASGRVKTVFQKSVLELFYEQVLEERVDLVELCLREATLSKEEKERMKEAFARNLIKHQRKGKSVKEKFKRIFHFLTETDAGHSELKTDRKRKREN